MRLYIFLLSGLAILSCSKDKFDPIFDLQYFNEQFEVRAGLNTIESHFFILRDIPTNKDFFFGNVPESEVGSIQPTNAILRSLEGNRTNYGFINDISVRICDQRIRSNDEIDRYCGRANEIFFRENIPIGIGSEVPLFPNSKNVKSILTQNDYDVVVVLRLRSLAPSFITTRLDMSFQAGR